MAASDEPKPGCACGRIDVHAHFLPEPYREALRKAGLTTLDGGFPIQEPQLRSVNDELTGKEYQFESFTKGL